MMNLKQAIEQRLQQIEPSATLSISDKADFQCNTAFALAKQRQQNPAIIANQLAEQWKEVSEDSPFKKGLNFLSGFGKWLITGK